MGFQSTCYEANANRELVQMQELFDKLAEKVSRKLGIKHFQLGDLVAYSQIYATPLSMNI